MNTKGRHLLLDVWLAQPLEECDIQRLDGIIRSAFHVVATARHDFSPEGTTLVLILSESHFTIHTYPEERYLSMDIYVCGSVADLQPVRELIISALSVEHLEARILERGTRLPQSAGGLACDPASTVQ